MENNNENNGFAYTYSASEQAEIRRIREKYKSKDEDKMERLRRLDMAVTQKAQIAALVLGVIGILLLGLGMSLIMSDLGRAFGSLAIPIGIVSGIIGGILAGLAYPIYNFFLRRERKKLAPEIIKLTDELMR